MAYKYNPFTPPSAFNADRDIAEGQGAVVKDGDMPLPAKVVQEERAKLH